MSDERVLQELTEKLKKALSSYTLSSVVKRDRMAAVSPRYELNCITDVTVVGSNGRQSNYFEATIIPSEVIRAPQEVSKSEKYESCGACGRMQKSNTSCKTCDSAHSVKEAVAYHRR